MPADINSISFSHSRRIITIKFSTNIEGYKDSSSEESNFTAIEFTLPLDRCYPMMYELINFDPMAKAHPKDPPPDRLNPKFPEKPERNSLPYFCNKLVLCCCFLWAVFIVFPAIIFNEILLIVGQFRIAHKHERHEIFNALVLYSNEVRTIRHYRMQMPVDFNKDVYDLGGMEVICKKNDLDMEFWRDFCKAPTPDAKASVIRRKKSGHRTAVAGGPPPVIARHDSVNSEASSLPDNSFRTVNVMPLHEAHAARGGGAPIATNTPVQRTTANGGQDSDSGSDSGEQRAPTGTIAIDLSVPPPPLSEPKPVEPPAPAVERLAPPANVNGSDGAPDLHPDGNVTPTDDAAVVQSVPLHTDPAPDILRGCPAKKR